MPETTETPKTTDDDIEAARKKAEDAWKKADGAIDAADDLGEEEAADNDEAVNP